MFQDSAAGTTHFENDQCGEPAHNPLNQPTKLKEVLIAFDIDGTLRNNDISPIAPVANEEIRTLLITLSKFKNVKILVWSGGGELYARQVCAALGLDRYVDHYASKIVTPQDGWGVKTPHPDWQPDIAIDDIHHCQLGKLNLIVRQK